MFSITEQFSAATKSQLEAQLNLLNSFASKAVESAQKVQALNISTAKASVETSSASARQLLEAKDPQAFFSVGKPPGFDHLLAYSRELFSIASAAQAELIQSAKEQIKQAALLLQRKLAQDVGGAGGVEGFADRLRSKTVPEIWRRAQHELAQHVGDRFQFAGEAIDSIRVAWAEFGDRLTGAAFAGQQIAAIGRGQEILRAALDDFQAVIA